MNTLLDLKQDIKSYVLSTTFGDKSKLTDETMIFREGYYDSMGFVTLIAHLEENYKVKTADEDLIEENFESINAIAKYVESKLK